MVFSGGLYQKSFLGTVPWDCSLGFVLGLSCWGLLLGYFLDGIFQWAHSQGLFLGVIPCDC